MRSPGHSPRLAVTFELGHLGVAPTQRHFLRTEQCIAMGRTAGCLLHGQTHALEQLGSGGQIMIDALQLLLAAIGIVVELFAQRVIYRAAAGCRLRSAGAAGRVHGRQLIAAIAIL